MAETFAYLLPKVINGSIAGIVGVTCVFPLDLIKTRLQNQQSGVKQLYKGWWDCASKTFRNEGFFGMYRGSAVNLLLITPEKAIKLAGNDFARDYMKKRRKGGQMTIGDEILSGMFAGMCQVIVTTPMELLKIQQQDAGRSAQVAQNAQGGATGTMPASTNKITATGMATRLIREKGLFSGLFQGFRPTLMRDVTFSAIYFPLFAHLNAFGKRADRDGVPFYHTFISGLLAGGVASLSVNPFDVVKTRLQTIAKGEGEKTYTGIRNCFVSVYRDEGITAFFKGGLCRILVIAPLFGIAQVVYFLGVAEFMLGIKKHSS